MNLIAAKNQLLAAKAEIEARLEATHRHIHNKPAPVSANFHEQIVETGNDAQVQALERQGRLELQQINNALQRLKAGDYLKCSSCSKPIGEQRLIALPYTDVCIKCAT